MNVSPSLIFCGARLRRLLPGCGGILLGLLIGAGTAQAQSAAQETGPRLRLELSADTLSETAPNAAMLTVVAENLPQGSTLRVTLIALLEETLCAAMDMQLIYGDNDDETLELTLTGGPGDVASAEVTVRAEDDDIPEPRTTIIIEALAAGVEPAMTALSVARNDYAVRALSLSAAEALADENVDNGAVTATVSLNAPAPAPVQLILEWRRQGADSPLSTRALTIARGEVSVQTSVSVLGFEEGSYRRGEGSYYDFTVLDDGSAAFDDRPEPAPQYAQTGLPLARTFASQTLEIVLVQLILEPASITLREGESATFTLRVVGPWLNMQVQWRTIGDADIDADTDLSFSEAFPTSGGTNRLSANRGPLLKPVYALDDVRIPNEVEPPETIIVVVDAVAGRGREEAPGVKRVMATVRIIDNDGYVAPPPPPLFIQLETAKDRISEEELTAGGDRTVMGVSVAGLRADETLDVELSFAETDGDGEPDLLFETGDGAPARTLTVTVDGGLPPVCRGLALTRATAQAVNDDLIEGRERIVIRGRSAPLEREAAPATAAVTIGFNDYAVSLRALMGLSGAEISGAQRGQPFAVEARFNSPAPAALNLVMRAQLRGGAEARTLAPAAAEPGRSVVDALIEDGLSPAGVWDLSIAPAPGFSESAGSAEDTDQLDMRARAVLLIFPEAVSLQFSAPEAGVYQALTLRADLDAAAPTTATLTVRLRLASDPLGTSQTVRVTVPAGAPQGSAALADGLASTGTWEAFVERGTWEDGSPLIVDQETVRAELTVRKAELDLRPTLGRPALQEGDATELRVSIAGNLPLGPHVIAVDFWVAAHATDLRLSPERVELTAENRSATVLVTAEDDRMAEPRETAVIRALASGTLPPGVVEEAPAEARLQIGYSDYRVDAMTLLAEDGERIREAQQRQPFFIRAELNAAAPATLNLTALILPEGSVEAEEEAFPFTVEPGASSGRTLVAEGRPRPQRWEIWIPAGARFSEGEGSERGVDDLVPQVSQLNAGDFLTVLPEVTALRFEPSEVAADQASTLRVSLDGPALRMATLRVNLRLITGPPGTLRSAEAVIAAGESEVGVAFAGGALPAGTWEASAAGGMWEGGPHLQTDETAALPQTLVVRGLPRPFLRPETAAVLREGESVVFRLSLVDAQAGETVEVTAAFVETDNDDVADADWGNAQTVELTFSAADGALLPLPPGRARDDNLPEPPETVIVRATAPGAPDSEVALLILDNDNYAPPLGAPLVVVIEAAKDSVSEEELTAGSHRTTVNVSVRGLAAGEPLDVELSFAAVHGADDGDGRPDMLFEDAGGALTPTLTVTVVGGDAPATAQARALDDDLVEGREQAVIWGTAPGAVTAPDIVEIGWNDYELNALTLFNLNGDRIAAADPGEPFNVELRFNAGLPAPLRDIAVRAALRGTGVLREMRVRVSATTQSLHLWTGGPLTPGTWDLTAAPLPQPQEPGAADEPSAAVTAPPRALIVRGRAVVVETLDDALAESAHTGNNATTLSVSLLDTTLSLPDLQAQVRLAVDPRHAADLSFSADAPTPVRELTVAANMGPTLARVWALDDDTPEPREAVRITGTISGARDGAVTVTIGWNDYALTGLTLFEEPRSGAIAQLTQGRTFGARLAFNAPLPSALQLSLRATHAERPLFQLAEQAAIAAGALQHLTPWRDGLPSVGDWTVAAVDNPPPAFSGAVAGVDEPAAAVAAPARNLEIVPDRTPGPVLEPAGGVALILEEGETASLDLYAVGVSADMLPAVMTLTLVESDGDGAPDAVLETAGAPAALQFPLQFPVEGTAWTLELRTLDDDLPEPPEEVILTLALPGAPSAVLTALIIDNDGYAPPPDGPFVIAIEAVKERISEEELAAGSHRTTVSVSAPGLPEGESLEVELTSADQYGVGDGDGEPDLLFEGADGALTPALTVTVTGGQGPATAPVQARDDGIAEGRERVLIRGRATSATATPDIVEIGWNDYDIAGLTLTDRDSAPFWPGDRITAIGPGEPFNVELEFNAGLPTTLLVTVRATLRGIGIVSEMDAFAGSGAARLTDPWRGPPLTAPGVWDVEATPQPPRFLSGSFMPFVDESTATATAPAQTLTVRGVQIFLAAQDQAIAENARTGNNATTLHVGVAGALPDPQVRVFLAIDPEHAGDLSFAAGAMMSTKALIITAGAAPTPVRIWALDDDLPERRETATIEATGEALGAAVAPDQETLRIGWNDYAVTELRLERAGTEIAWSTPGRTFDARLAFNSPLPSTLRLKLQAALPWAGISLLRNVEIAANALQHLAPWAAGLPFAGNWTAAAVESAFSGALPGVDDATVAVTAPAGDLQIIADGEPPPGGPFVVVIEAAKEAISEEELAAGSNATTVSVSVEGLRTGETLDVELTFADGYRVVDSDGDGEPERLLFEDDGDADLLFEDDGGATTRALTVTATGGAPLTVRVRARDDGVAENRERVLIRGTAPGTAATPDIVEIGWNDYALTALTLADADGDRIAAIGPGEPFNVELEFNAELPTTLLVTVRATLRGIGIVSEMEGRARAETARLFRAWGGAPLTTAGLWEAEALAPLHFPSGSFAPFVDESTATVTASPQTLIVRGLQIFLEAQDRAIAENAGVGDNATTLNISVVNTLLSPDPQVRVRLTVDPEHAGDLSFRADAIMATRELTIMAGAEPAPAPVRVWALDDGLPELRETVTIEAIGEALGEGAGTQAVADREELRIGWNDYALTGLTLERLGIEISRLASEQDFSVRLRLNSPTPSTLNLRLRAELSGSELSLSQDIEIAPNALEHLAPWAGGLPMAGDWTVAAVDEPPPAFSGALPGVDDSTAAVTAAARNLRTIEPRRGPVLELREGADLILEEGQRAGFDLRVFGVSADLLPAVMTWELIDSETDGMPDAVFWSGAAGAETAHTELQFLLEFPLEGKVWPGEIGALDDDLPEPPETVIVRLTAPGTPAVELPLLILDNDDYAPRPGEPLVVVIEAAKERMSEKELAAGSNRTTVSVSVRGLAAGAPLDVGLTSADRYGVGDGDGAPDLLFEDAGGALAPTLTVTVSGGAPLTIWAQARDDGVAENRERVLIRATAPGAAATPDIVEIGWNDYAATTLTLSNMNGERITEMDPGEPFFVELELNAAPPGGLLITVRAALRGTGVSSRMQAQVPLTARLRRPWTGGPLTPGVWDVTLAPPPQFLPGSFTPFVDESMAAVTAPAQTLIVRGRAAVVKAQDGALLENAQTGGNATTLHVSVVDTSLPPDLRVRTLLTVEPERVGDLSFAADAIRSTLELTITANAEPVPVRVWALNDGLPERREFALIEATGEALGEATGTAVVPGRELLLIGWNDYALTGLTLERSGTEISQLTQGRAFGVRLRFNGPLPTVLNLRLRATLPGTGVALSEHLEILPNALEHLALWTGGLPLAGDWTVAAVADPPPALINAVPGEDDLAAAVAAPPRNLRIIADDEAPTAPYLELEAAEGGALIFREGEEARLSLRAVGVPQDLLPTVMTLTLFEADNDGEPDAFLGTQGMDAARSFPVASVPSGNAEESVSMRALDDNLPEPPEEAIAILSLPGAPSVAARMLIIDNDNYAPAPGEPLVIVVEAAKEAISEKELATGSRRTTISVSVRGLPAGEPLDVRLTSADGYGVGDGDGAPDLLFEDAGGALAPELTVTATGGAPLTVWAQARDDDIVEDRERVLIRGTAPGAAAEPDIIRIGWNDYQVTGLTLIDIDSDRLMEIDPGALFYTQLEFNAELPAWLIMTVRATLQGSGIFRELRVFGRPTVVNTGQDHEWNGALTTPGIWDVALIPWIANFTASFERTPEPFVDESTATVIAPSQALTVWGLRAAVEAQDQAIAENAQTGSNATTLNVRVVNTVLFPRPEVRVLLTVDPEHAGDLSFAPDAMMATKALTVTAGAEPTISAEPVPVRVWALDDDLPEPRELAAIEASGEALGEAAGMAVVPGRTELRIGWSDYEVTALALSDRNGDSLTAMGPGEPFNVSLELNAGRPTTLLATVRATLRGSGISSEMEMFVSPSVLRQTLPWSGAPLTAPGIWDLALTPPPRFPAGSFAPFVDEATATVTAPPQTLVVRGLRVTVQARDGAIAEEALTGNNATMLNVSVVNTLLSPDPQVRVRLALDPEHAGDLSFAAGAATPMRELTVTASAEPTPTPAPIWALDDDLPELRETATIEATGEALGEAAGTEIISDREELRIGWNDYEVTALTLTHAGGDRIAMADPDQPFNVKLEFNARPPTTLLVTVRATPRGPGSFFRIEAEAGPTTAQLIIPWPWPDAPLAPGVWDVEVTPPPRFPAGSFTPFVDESTAAVTAPPQTLTVQQLRMIVEAQDQAIAENAQTGNNATTLNVSVVSAAPSSNPQVRALLALDPEHAGDLSFAADAMRSTKELTVTAGAAPTPVRVWALDDDLPEPRETVIIEAAGEALGEAAGTEIISDREELRIGWNDYALTGLTLERFGGGDQPVNPGGGLWRAAQVERADAVDA